MHADFVKTGLAARLRADTAPLHSEAERSGLMVRLLRGNIAQTEYCRLLRSLHAIYSALEQALARNAARADLAPVCLPELARTAALEDDLSVLHGEGWREDIAIAESAAEYVRHIELLEASQPALLAAHSYVRHLGDLYGGQMLRRVVASSFGLGDGIGTRFYAFGTERVADLIARYRAGLDALPQDIDSIEAMVAEAQWGFVRHIRLFGELA
jgi:heme oxygenase